MLISRKPCEIEQFQWNFLPIGYLCRVHMPIFIIFMSCQIWRPFWIFEFLAKIAKHKNAYISKTVLDRGISTKFLTQGYICRVVIPIFKKILSRQKWRPFWIMSTPLGGGYIIFAFSAVRRPMSGVTHGFRSFKGKVLELLSPNLVCRLIGSVAFLGLLLAVVPLLLTE